MTTPRVASLNVGVPRIVQWRGQEILTSIWKHPVEGRRRIDGVNIAGDDQADRRVHGGRDKAVYAYALEDLEWWAATLNGSVEPGLMGENLTTAGLPVTDAMVGERWQVGRAVLEVAAPRVPCYKLGIRTGDPSFPRRFARAMRPGAYLRIITPGEVAAGDRIEVVDRPEHGVTVGLVAEAYHHDRSLLPRLLDAPELDPGWHDWAHSVLNHSPRRGEGAAEEVDLEQ